MKACPICGSTFSGDEMFCPHDGARLIVHDQPAQLVGEQLHHLVDLKRLIFKDAFGERYIGEMTSSHVEVKVTVFNQAFTPPEGRLEALVSTKMLLDSPLPPQIATAYAWSVDEEPSYLIESNPKGPSLRLLLEERGHIDWRTALKIICSLARNLDWMDGQGVVHRCIQPESIYVTDIQHGYTHLSEWAIGVLAYQSSPLEALSQGQLVIAPGYTAPELVGGKASADRRSMIYTLGILLYEMLTGKAPFSAPGSEEILKRIKRERPVKLSMAYPEGDLPPGLDDLFEVMTAKQPDKRFQSLQAVTNALSTLLDDGTSASDFPDPVRAKEETDIHKKNGKTPKEVDDTTSKKTMLFISSDELQSKISEASEIAEAKAPASKPEKSSEKVAEKEDEIDEAGKATVQMDRSVLEQDQKERKEAADDSASKADKEGADAKTAEDTKESDAKADADAGADVDDEEDSDSDKDTEGTTSRKKKRKKKRKRTDLMHEAANEAKAQKADADKDESNGVQVDDPSPTGNFTAKIEEEAKGGTTKIIIDEDFARDAKSAETPSIVVDESLTADAEEPPAKKSKGVSGESITKTDEKPEVKEEKEDEGDKKSSSKKSRKKKSKSSDADKEDSSSAKADAKSTDKSGSKTEDKSKEKKDEKSEKSDDKDKATADKKGEDDKKASSKKRRKPARDAQEETARLPAAKTETKSGDADADTDKKDDKDKKSSASTKGTKKKPEDAASTDAAAASMEFVPQLTNDANLDEHWFSTDTEAAWDREVLMEHTARTEQKVNKVFMTAIIIFVIFVLAFFIYLLFIYDGDEAEGEASLDRPAVEHQLASWVGALEDRIG